MALKNRSYGLAGASNFRDLGGYVGHGGRHVKWGKIFRSDHLGLLTAQDTAHLASLGLARICDFRGATERQLRPSVLPGVPVHSLAIEPTVVQALHDFAARGQGLTEADAVQLMQQTYRDFVTHNSPRFKQLFDHLLESDAPLVFHCTAGKDRTGLAAALILLALGVDEATVMQDYLLTNDLYKAPDLVGGGAPPEVRAVIARVQQDFLLASLHTINTRHGSAAEYLRLELGLNDAARTRLASLYLQA